MDLHPPSSAASAQQHPLDQLAMKSPPQGPPLKAPPSNSMHKAPPIKAPPCKTDMAAFFQPPFKEPPATPGGYTREPQLKEPPPHCEWKPIQPPPKESSAESARSDGSARSSRWGRSAGSAPAAKAYDDAADRRGLYIPRELFNISGCESCRQQFKMIGMPVPLDGTPAPIEDGLPENSAVQIIPRHNSGLRRTAVSGPEAKGCNSDCPPLNPQRTGRMN